MSGAECNSLLYNIIDAILWCPGITAVPKIAKKPLSGNFRAAERFNATDDEIFIRYAKVVIYSESSNTKFIWASS